MITLKLSIVLSLRGLKAVAISRYNISILLCISMNCTGRLHRKGFPSVPRRALRLCPPRNDKTVSFSIYKLVGTIIDRPLESP